MKQLSILFALMICSSLSSQEVLLQHLDHDNRHSHITSVCTYKGGIVYSVSNDGAPMTRLMYIDSTEEVHTLYSHQYYEHFEVECYENENDKLEIYMFGLWDYDIGIPFVFKFEFDGSEVIFNSIGDYEQWTFFSDVHRLENGDLAVISDGQVQIIDAIDSSLTIIDHDPLWQSKLFTNFNGGLFLYDQTNIYKVGQELELLQSVEDQILDIQILDETRMLVTTETKAFYFHSESFEVLNSLTYPDNLSFNSGLDVIGGDIHILLENTFGTQSIWKINDQAEFEWVYEVESTVYQNRFLIKDEEHFILGGDYLTLKPNGVIRRISDVNAFDHRYIDISLDSLFLEVHSDKEPYININGDTLYFDSYRYDYRLVVSNQGEDTIHHFDLYSESFYGHYSSKIFLSLHFELDILPGETKVIEDFFFYAFSPIPIHPNLQVYIPGANYLVDADFTDNIIVVNDIISSTANPTAVSPFKIYPNPTSDFLYVEGFEANTSFAIYNLQGQLVMKSKTLENVIDVSQLQSGFYVLKFFR